MDMQSKAKKLIEMIQTAPVEWKPLGEVVNIKNGKDWKNLSSGDIPVYGSGGVMGYVDTFAYDKPSVLIPRKGSITNIFYVDFPFWNVDTIYYTEIDTSKLKPKFFYYFMRTIDLMALDTGSGRPSLTQKILNKIKIPIPPLETQQKIVKILDKFTELESTLEAALEAELALRKRQYQYYRGFLLDFDNRIWGGIADGYKGRLKDVVWKTLGEVCENLDSMRKPITSNFRKAGNIPYYGASGIVDYVKDFILDGDYLLVSEDGANLLARKTPIAFSVSGKIWVNNHAHILKFRTYAERRFIEFYLNNIDISMYISGAAQPKLNKQNLNKIRIPIPPLPEQEKIVAILDKFDTLTNSINEGLPHEIALRRKQYEYYREQLLAFPKAA